MTSDTVSLSEQRERRVQNADVTSGGKSFHLLATTAGKTAGSITSDCEQRRVLGQATH